MNVLDYIENQLLLCLCSMLHAEGRPPCACHHYGGEEPPVGDRCKKNDEGQNGQVWARRVQQTSRVEADEVTFGGVSCDGAWTAVIELGIYRCISATPVEGGAPPVEAYDADRELLAADRATLAQVLCCWPLQGDPPTPQPFQLDISVQGAEIAPTGPTGACAGSILTLTLATALTAEEEAGPIWVSRPAGAA